MSLRSSSMACTAALMLLVTFSSVTPSFAETSCEVPCKHCRSLRIDVENAELPDVLNLLALAGGFRIATSPCLESHTVGDLKLDGTMDEVLATLREEFDLVCRTKEDALLVGCSESELDGLVAHQPIDPRKEG